MRIQMDRQAWNILTAYPIDSRIDPRSIMSRMLEVLPKGCIVEVTDVIIRRRGKKP